MQILLQIAETMLRFCIGLWWLTFITQANHYSEKGIFPFRQTMIVTVGSCIILAVLGLIRKEGATGLSLSLGLMFPAGLLLVLGVAKMGRPFSKKEDNKGYRIIEISVGLFLMLIPTAFIVARNYS